MIVFINATGTMSRLIPETLYQGSAMDGQLFLVAPFPSTNAVSVRFTLPNGDYTKSYPMIATKIDTLTDTEYNAWEMVGNNAEITAYSGVLKAQFSIGHAQDGVLKNQTTASVNITVAEGTLPIPSSTPTADEWELLLAMISTATGVLPVVKDFSIDEIASSDGYVYGKKTLTDGTKTDIKIPTEAVEVQYTSEYLKVIEFTAGTWDDDTIEYSSTVTGYTDNRFTAYVQLKSGTDYVNVQPTITVKANGGLVIAKTSGETAYAGRIILIANKVLGKFIEAFVREGNSVIIRLADGGALSLDLSNLPKWATKQDKLTSANAGQNITITTEGGVVKINSTASSEGQLTYGGTVEDLDSMFTSPSDYLRAKLSLSEETDRIYLVNRATDDTESQEYGYVTLADMYFIVNTEPYAQSEDAFGLDLHLGDWLVSNGQGWHKIDNSESVTGVKGSAESEYRKGNVNITKANIGLGNVDNTSDLNKPISTLQQAVNASVAEDIGTLEGNITTLSGAVDDLETDLNGVDSRVETIEGLIPTEASTSNQLADKAYVDEHGVSKYEIMLSGESGTLTDTQFTTLTDNEKNAVIVNDGERYYLAEEVSGSYRTYINITVPQTTEVVRKAIYVNISSGAVNYKSWNKELEEDSKLDKATTSGGAKAVYTVQGETQSTTFVSNTPTANNIPIYDANGKLKSNTPITDDDVVTKSYADSKFAPLSFVSHLYGTLSGGSIYLSLTPPTASANNILQLIGSTNTSYNWSSPSTTFVKQIQTETKLAPTNSLTITLKYKTNRNATISWGAIIQKSTNGTVWTTISSQQSFNAVSVNANNGTTTDITVYPDLISGVETLNAGDYIRIQLFKKQESATALDLDMYFGVMVDNAYICTFAQFNFTNVTVDTSQLADGSVTREKLAQSVKDDIDGKLDKVTSTGNKRAYIIGTDGSQSTLPIGTDDNTSLLDKAKGDSTYLKSGNATSSPTANTTMQRDSNGRSQVATPSANNDIANKSYVDNYHDSTKQNSLNATQLNAVNSGITSTRVNTYDGYASGKQNTLVSGTNIKTLNGQSILGSGDLSIAGGTIGYEEVE